jgi:hypothetical protein
MNRMFRSLSILFLLAAISFILSFSASTSAESNDFAQWRLTHGKWYEAGEASLNPTDARMLVGTPGEGVLINGPDGDTPSLVSKESFQDVHVHLEFMVAEGSNSGVSFHGNYEIQILDSAHIENPTAGHCGGVYPRAEAEPTYHHIDEGSPPRVNAAKAPGEWQTLDIIFQSPRFNEAGEKITNAKFVRVVHNGLVIQENVETPWANGTNWDRPQRPSGPVIIQGDYGPIAIRNATLTPWDGEANLLNVPPKGFTPLFNGEELTNWKVNPKVEEMWSIEDGVLKSHGLLEEWGADLVTIDEYDDYELMVDFRFPAPSDSGIHFRNFVPALQGAMGHAEQLNLRSSGGTGDLESFHLVPEVMRLPNELHPKSTPFEPEIGTWHTVKLTVVGKSISTEMDGKVQVDHFEYPAGILAVGPNEIRLQKHRFVEWRPGEKNPCPIEFRNIFIRKIGPEEAIKSQELNVPPEGFTALFNGEDLTGWRTNPLVEEYWSVEEGVLKSHGLIEQWGACLATEKHYRDFSLMLEFRMPTISDSGICFRRLIPEIPGFGNQEQFNLRSRGGMGHLESYYFLPEETAQRVGLIEEEKPHVRHIDPEVGVWHKVKLTVVGRTIWAEFDEELILDGFTYHDWMLNMEPAPIRLQKHIVVHGDNLGAENPCPIEYRNIFIRELDQERFQTDSRNNNIFIREIRDGETFERPEPAMPDEHSDSPVADLLMSIDQNDLPGEYEPARHQDYVDRRMAELSKEQRGMITRLWREKEQIDPGMSNQGFSFVKILEYIAENVE